MADNSKIEWTDATWNPVRGCSMAKGSEAGGCLNCYAARYAVRGLQRDSAGDPFAIMRDSGPRWTGKVELVEATINRPLYWRKPRRIFVNSQSDLFHESLSFEDIDRIFTAMVAADWHTYQILTKRPERMLAYFRSGRHDGGHGPDRADYHLEEKIWLGVSVENQDTWDARVPLLAQVPATKRFVSYEPALEDISFGFGLWIKLLKSVKSDLPFGPRPIAGPGIYRVESNPHGALSVRTSNGLLGVKPDEFEKLSCPNWVIVGGESGPGARPFDVQWARNTISQCKAAGVACFVKQMGARVADENSGWGIGYWEHDGDVIGPVLADKKGGDWSEWPEDLRVREFPA